jgi:RNA polymerase sigma factor (sigma-70 family)
MVVPGSRWIGVDRMGVQAEGTRPLPSDHTDPSRAARGTRAVRLEDLDDEQLVELAKGDRVAFSVLYRRHVRAVYHYAHRLCGGDRAAAEDVTSATFERALAAIARFEWRGVGVRPWLLRIASSEVGNWYRATERVAGQKGQDAARSALRLQGINGSTVEIGSSEAATEQQAAEQLRVALAQLPERYREVISLRYLAGLGADEAAQAMGCSKGTLAVTLHRAITALRRGMADNIRSLDEGSNEAGRRER